MEEEKMEKPWNFHGYIALPLEQLGRKDIGQTFYTADEIEAGDFVDAMASLLSINNIKCSSFSSKCDVFKDKPASEIGAENTKELYSDFLGLYRSKKTEK